MRLLTYDLLTDLLALKVRLGEITPCILVVQSTLTPSLPFQYFEKYNCPETHCIVTSNKTYLPSPSDYDVIALNSWNIPSIDVFPDPSTRHPNQIYAIYYHESPSRTKQSLSQYSNLFNWTMSFR